MNAAVVDKTPTLWEQLRRALAWAKLLSLGVVLLFVLMAVGEMIRIHQTVAAQSEILGYLTLLGFGGVFVLIGMPVYRFLRMPRVVQPPPVPPPESVRLEHLDAEIRYLDRYLANCANNLEMFEKKAEIARARADLALWPARVNKAESDQAQQLGRDLAAWTEATMPSILRDVDKKADRLIYQEALAVGMATAASPNGTLDAFFMLWRSVNLVSQLANLYYGRPGVRGTLAVCRDVSIATAMAGYLQNVTDTLGGLLAKSVGGMTGVVAGPAVEGATNALVLIRIGYLAQERCRSLRKWDARTRRSAILSALSATQKVGFGLTSEIMRQFGHGITAVAGAAGRGVARAAGSAADCLGVAAESAIAAASDWSQMVTSVLRGKKEPTPPTQG